MYSIYYSKLEATFFKIDDDPLKAQKNLVNNIQYLVGIRNVFGEKGIRKFTVFSTLAAMFFCGVFVYVGSFSQLYYMYQVFPDKIRSFQALNCISATSVPLSKFIFMFTCSSRLRKIMEMSQQGLTAISKNGAAHKTMLTTLRKAHIVSWLVIFNQGLVHFFYLVLPVVFIILGNERYLPTTPGDIFGIPSRYESPYYEITYILIIISTFFSAVNQTGYVILFVVLLAHELGHLNVICEILNEVHEIVKAPYTSLDGNDTIRHNSEIKDTKQNTVDERFNLELKKHVKIEEMLIFCVKHHQFLIKLHRKVNDLYKAIFGAHFLIVIIVLVSTLQTMNSWGVVNTILTGSSATMPLVVYCFGGEMLIASELAMTEAVYACGWEGMRVKHARIVHLILCIAQHPLCYTATGIFIMNRQTFGNVAQVVYKIYAVFN